MNPIQSIVVAARAADARGWATFGAGVVFALLFPVFLIAGNVGLIAHSGWLYSYNWWRNGIADRTGLPVPELDRAADQIKAYFRNDAERLQVYVDDRGSDVGIFVEREILHMVDVKAIMVLVDGLALWTGVAVALAVAACVTLRRREVLRQLASWLRWTALGWGIALVAVVVASLIDFGWVFTVFHELSFANDLWLLDPYRHWLLLLFPQRFFFEATLLLGALAVAQYAAAYVAVRVGGWGDS